MLSIFLPRCPPRPASRSRGITSHPWDSAPEFIAVPLQRASPSATPLLLDRLMPSIN